MSLMAAGQPSAVLASVGSQQLCFNEYDWQELESDSFTLIFPTVSGDLADEIITEFTQEIEGLSAAYSQVFKLDLLLPVIIRIYPLVEDYDCLNPLAAPVVGEEPHAHLSSREIALFAERFPEDVASRRILILSALRGELAALFVEELTGGFAPVGLIDGIIGYVQDPEEMFQARFTAAGQPGVPVEDWGALWGGSSQNRPAAYLFDTTTTVAYLVDVYGWGNFIRFLSQIMSQQGYHRALLDVYGLNQSELESHWKVYYPAYIDDRHRFNIFYRYDLDSLRLLVEQGAYQEAIPRLEDAVLLLNVLGKPDQAGDAAALLEQAILGDEASELTNQARQALFTGKYQASFDAAQQALAIYAQLGDLRRTTELQAYLEVSGEVLELRVGLAEIIESGVGFNPLRILKVYDLGRRLLKLGDAQGAVQAELMLDFLGPGQNAFFQLVISFVIFLSLGLIIRQLLSRRDEIPPEADLR